MTPVAMTTKRKPEPEAVPVPEVHEALARRHAADIERQDRMLKAYREAVALAADGKPIPPSVADAAVEAAHALGLKASRLTDDIVAMRRALTCERQHAEYVGQSADRKARAQEVKLEIAAAERLIRDLRAEHHRLTMGGLEMVGWVQERDDIKRQFPHLFKAAADMDDKSWRHVRA
jgi:hypothetical protein